MADFKSLLTRSLPTLLELTNELANAYFDDQRKQQRDCAFHRHMQSAHLDSRELWERAFLSVLEVNGSVDNAAEVADAALAAWRARGFGAAEIPLPEVDGPLN